MRPPLDEAQLDFEVFFFPEEKKDVRKEQLQASIFFFDRGLHLCPCARQASRGPGLYIHMLAYLTDRILQEKQNTTRCRIRLGRRQPFNSFEKA